MALRRRSSLLLIPIAVVLILVSLLAGPAAARKTGQLTVFWGRNKNEGTLRETCDSGLYTTVIISFYSGVFRPFRDTAVDRVDFFIDHGAPDHYDELARNLNGYNNKLYRVDGGRKRVRLTATPRCAFPDRRVERALRTGLFERIHVRFYNDDAKCSYNRGGLAGVMEQWDRWTARYLRSKVYLGLAAANSPGKKKDIVHPKALIADLLPAVQKARNYGDVINFFVQGIEKRSPNMFFIWGFE
uniref:GH18 domain-containing protein n=1 Tax=Oryza punctata TaxID=4537 RepID=A0A0E0M7W0_ORYPU